MMCLPTYYSTGNNASPSYQQQPQPPRDDKYGGSSCLVGIMQLLWWDRLHCVTVPGLRRVRSANVPEFTWARSMSIGMSPQMGFVMMKKYDEGIEKILSFEMNDFSNAMDGHSSLQSLCVLGEDWGGCDWHFLLCCLLDPKVLLLLLAVLLPFYCAAEMFSFNFNTLHQYCLKFVVIPISQRPINMCGCEYDDGIVTRMNNNNILIGTKSNYHYIYTLLLCTWGTVSLSLFFAKNKWRQENK